MTSQTEDSVLMSGHLESARMHGCDELARLIIVNVNVLVFAGHEQLLAIAGVVHDIYIIIIIALARDLRRCHWFIS